MALKHRWAGATVGLVLVSASVFAAPTSATNYSGATGNTGCEPESILNEADDYYHLFYWDDLTDKTQTAANNSRLDDLEPTALSTFVLSSSGESIDVAAHDNDYTNYCGYNWSTIAGLATCAYLREGTSKCEKHHVYFDLSDVNNLSLSERNSLTCHEFGHTVGLKHRPGGCMTGDPVWPVDLTDHDRDHIQANY